MSGIGDFSVEAGQQPVENIATAEDTSRPIDLLKPQSELHTRVLEYLLKRLNYSERTMSQFYPRWNANERRVQAYISLPKYEEMLKQMNATGTPPAVTSITVPYAYATIWTIVTYLTHTFCGSKPMFQLQTYKAEAEANVPYAETMLQFNADHTRMILRLIQWFIDAELYGVGAMRCLWKEEKAYRTVWTTQSPGGAILPNAPAQTMRQRLLKTIYEGNEVSNIDPYMFFPDPRVPMSECSRRGEFVFWRHFEGKHVLKRAEARGDLAHIDAIGAMPSYTGGEASGSSVRALTSSGNNHPGDPNLRDIRANPYFQIDQGTIEIIPSELGLGPSDEPEKWLFSIGNKSQIIQAEPLDLDHGRHPIVVIEPGSLGYAFGQCATADMLGPIQDTLSWFVNSHIHNVRSSLNNMFVVDPSMVELQDLKNPEPGKLIRLKRSAFGQDVRAALQQLEVRDVTANHMQSLQMFLKIGDTLSAVNDNMRGIQDSGGRKTATEVRTSGEASSSRLAFRARYISAQGMVDLGEQMLLNMQQNQTMEYYLQIVGAKGLAHPIPITPQSISGDFTFPVNDGTLPIDKTAMLGVWKEIWMAIVSNPWLAQRYDPGKIFEYMAELGGAKNIDSFKVSAAPEDQINAGLQAGNLVPIGPGSSAAPSPGTMPGPGGPV